MDRRREGPRQAWPVSLHLRHRRARPVHAVGGAPWLPEPELGRGHRCEHRGGPDLPGPDSDLLDAGPGAGGVAGHLPARLEVAGDRGRAARQLLLALRGFQTLLREVGEQQLQQVGVLRREHVRDRHGKHQELFAPRRSPEGLGLCTVEGGERREHQDSQALVSLAALRLHHRARLRLRGLREVTGPRGIGPHGHSPPLPVFATQRRARGRSVASELRHVLHGLSVPRRASASDGSRCAVHVHGLGRRGVALPPADRRYGLPNRGHIARNARHALALQVWDEPTSFPAPRRAAGARRAPQEHRGCCAASALRVPQHTVAGGRCREDEVAPLVTAEIHTAMRHLPALELGSGPPGQECWCWAGRRVG
mmetsp:Transcript_59376/g.153472  ORF Transcript_59376/g.153472 Transcript_59376/m.153472 type:complete len:366 (-) Transcript_59376:101-1198(-)